MSPGAPSKRPPNVVSILAGDLGWRDTSRYGNTFCETPNRSVGEARDYARSGIGRRPNLLTDARQHYDRALSARVGFLQPSSHSKSEAARQLDYRGPRIG
jgi:hypothetical protein